MTESKEKKKFCESMSAFIVFLLIKIKKKKKNLIAVIHTVNHLVYAINSEVWKHVLLANGFNYLASTFMH